MAFRPAACPGRVPSTMDRVVPILQVSALVLLVVAIVLYRQGQPVAAVAVLVAAIGDAVMALWFRGRSQRRGP